eukprot:TRINITY_DN7034_c0_g4_i1.p1 TRINITY_DN7034_c0_g4~~TRINITY_DN7034_c0_g4_i1.p1  ORF type:complete len:293 (-),score=29.77 TRINITY_DN7034_c0_g4_i1:876-1754(-)
MYCGRVWCKQERRSDTTMPRFFKRCGKCMGEPAEEQEKQRQMVLDDWEERSQPQPAPPKRNRMRKTPPQPRNPKSSRHLGWRQIEWLITVALDDKGLPRRHCLRHFREITGIGEAQMKRVRNIHKFYRTGRSVADVRRKYFAKPKGTTTPLPQATLDATKAWLRENIHHMPLAPEKLVFNADVNGWRASHRELEAHLEEIGEHGISLRKYIECTRKEFPTLSRMKLTSDARQHVADQDPGEVEWCSVDATLHLSVDAMKVFKFPHFGTIQANMIYYMSGTPSQSRRLKENSK